MSRGKEAGVARLARFLDKLCCSWLPSSSDFHGRCTYLCGRRGVRQRRRGARREERKKTNDGLRRIRAIARQRVRRRASKVTRSRRGERRTAERVYEEREVEETSVERRVENVDDRLVRRPATAVTAASTRWRPRVLARCREYERQQSGPFRRGKVEGRKGSRAKGRDVGAMHGGRRCDARLRCSVQGGESAKRLRQEEAKKENLGRRRKETKNAPSLLRHMRLSDLSSPPTTLVALLHMVIHPRHVRIYTSSEPPIVGGRRTRRVDAEHHPLVRRDGPPSVGPSACPPSQQRVRDEVASFQRCWRRSRRRKGRVGFQRRSGCGRKKCGSGRKRLTGSEGQARASPAAALLLRVLDGR